MTERLHTCTGERGTVACEACADGIGPAPAVAAPLGTIGFIAPDYVQAAPRPDGDYIGAYKQRADVYEVYRSGDALTVRGADNVRVTYRVKAILRNQESFHPNLLALLRVTGIVPAPAPTAPVFFQASTSDEAPTAKAAEGPRWEWNGGGVFLGRLVADGTDLDMYAQRNVALFRDSRGPYGSCIGYDSATLRRVGGGWERAADMLDAHNARASAET